MLLAILGFVIVIMLITLFGTYQSAAKIKKNILLNVYLPMEYAKKTEVMEITNLYKKMNQRLLIIFTIVAVPIFFIHYSSFQLLYLTIWFGLYMFLCNKCLIFYNLKLVLLKSRNAWFYDDSMSHVLKDEKLKKWFIKHQLLNQDTEEIYVDDDEYWLTGNYNNPFDKRTMVEKRVGVGTTLNMATKGSKIFNLFMIGFIITVVGGIFLLLVTLDFTTYHLTVNNDKINIKASLYSYEFQISDIEEISLIDSMPQKGVRTNGASTDTYMLGNFNLSGIGKSKVYVYNDKPPYIKIKLRNLTVFFNTKSENKTKDTYKMLMDTLGLS